MEYVAVILGFLLLLSLAGRVYETLAERRDRQHYPPPGNLFSVDDHKLHLHCAGERRPQRPVVVLEAGLGSCSFDWRRVQPEVARWGRVCVYDRAGYGWSEPSRSPQSLAQMAADLHQLLASAGEAGPYLLVGHSFGGILVREFFRQHPQEVAGMVLVDSAHEAQVSRLPAGELKGLEVSLRLYRVLAFLARFGIVRLLARPLLLRSFASVRSPQEQAVFLPLISQPKYFATLCAETEALLRSSAADSKPPDLGQIPLAVVQATGRPPALPGGYSEERWLATRKMFDAIQHELAGLSRNSQLIQAEKSVHAVQLEQPEIVIAAIWQVAHLVKPG